nr:RNA-directed DNA polymerase, eukaryota [Tanacetum cinerariifolium]
MDGCVLADMMDRWFWALEGSGEFTITSVMKMIDDFMLPEVSSKTRWIKAVPIQVNVHAWKVKLDGLPTRLNISPRGIDIESILCPMDLLLRKMVRLDLKYASFGQKQAVIRRSVLCVVVACLEFS